MGSRILLVFDRSSRPHDILARTMFLFLNDVALVFQAAMHDSQNGT